MPTKKELTDLIIMDEMYNEGGGINAYQHIVNYEVKKPKGSKQEYGFLTFQIDAETCQEIMSGKMFGDPKFLWALHIFDKKKFFAAKDRLENKKNKIKG